MTKQEKAAAGLSVLRQNAEKRMNPNHVKSNMQFSGTEMLRLVHELEVCQIELELQNEELILANELAAKAANEKYAELYNLSPSGYFTLSKGGEIIELNTCGSQMINKIGSQSVNCSFGSFVSDDTKRIFNLFLIKIFSLKVKETCEVTLIVNDNMPRYVFLTGIFKENEGNCLLTVVDITGRKLAEETLQDNNSRLELAMQVANMAWWEMDVPTGKVTFEKRKAEMLGYPSEKFKTYKDFTSLVHPEDVGRTMNAMIGHFEGRFDKYEVEYRILTKSGVHKWFHDIGSIVKRNSEGKPLNVTGLVFDITERKKIEEAVKQLNEGLEDRVKVRTAELLKSNTSLRQTEEKYRTVADFTYDWEYWINAEGRFNYVSPSCERITGYTSNEFNSNSELLDQIIFSADLAVWKNHKNEDRPHKSGDINPDLNFRIVTKSGDIRWICCVSRRIYLNGKYLGIRASNRDITEKINAENELLNVTIEVEERERNRFSSELHDGLGPLLSTIKLYFQWLAETDNAEKIKIITEKGNNCIEKAIQTTREVALGLSSLVLNNSGYVDTILNFTQSINDTQKLNIDFTFNCNDRFSFFLETTLYRITTELINNTLKYARASHVEIVFDYSKKNNLIVLNYRDDGIGFNLANTVKTSKGLGLMHIQQRIKIIKGIMKIETSAGKGVDVYIELPVIVPVNGTKPKSKLKILHV